MMTDDTLFHVDEGEGTPILLLNGIAMSAAGWEPIAAPLRARFRVVRCDLRGQLMSPKPAPRDVAEHVRDVVRLLDELGIERVHLVGTSFGGAVAALVAARRSRRALSLLSIASADGFTDEMAAEVARWRTACVAALEGPDRDVFSDTLEPVVYSERWLEEHAAERAMRREVISQLPEDWLDGLVGLLDSAESFRLHRDDLGRIRCPTRVVAAELDGFIPRERTRALADAIPRATFEVIQGAGHAVVVEQPGLLADMIGRFVEIDASS